LSGSGAGAADKAGTAGGHRSEAASVNPSPAGAAAARVEVVRGGTRRPRLGTVQDFDAGRGLGLVLSAGGASYLFHSTAVSDGSRLITPGTAVVFSVVAAPGGRFEAVAVTPV